MADCCNATRRKRSFIFQASFSIISAPNKAVPDENSLWSDGGHPFLPLRCQLAGLLQKAASLSSACRRHHSSLLWACASYGGGGGGGRLLSLFCDPAGGDGATAAEDDDDDAAPKEDEGELVQFVL